MYKTSPTTALAAALLSACLLPLAAAAQDPAPAPEPEPVPAAAPQPAPQSIALGVDRGSVLVSSGGEFVQAAPGQALSPGDRVLVPENAAATLTYANGCTIKPKSGGVHVVEAGCVAAAGRSAPSAGVIAAGVAGVAVLAAAAGGGGGGDDKPTPVSR